MINDVLHEYLSIGSSLGVIAILAMSLPSLVAVASARSARILANRIAICVVTGVLLDYALFCIVGLDLPARAIFLPVSILGLAIHLQMNYQEEASRALDTILLGRREVFGRCEHLT